MTAGVTLQEHVIKIPNLKYVGIFHDFFLSFAYAKR